LKLIEASQQGRVLNLTLNRPEKRNALSMELCRALVEAFAQANHDPSIGAIVLSGKGPAFCAGMDLKEALNEARQKGDEELATLHERLFTVADRATKPIVVAVHGAVAGGGVGIAANSHVLIASPDARFALTEIKIGLWPVMIFPALSLAMGERRTMELSLTGRFFSAQEAHDYGLVTEMADDPLARAREVADQLGAFSANALAKGMAYSRSLRHKTSEEANALGRKARAELMLHPDFENGVNAFFRK
jgi:enoyl-CoA hydratase/carnithine racemase